MWVKFLFIIISVKEMSERKPSISALYMWGQCHHIHTLVKYGKGESGKARKSIKG